MIGLTLGLIGSVVLNLFLIWYLLKVLSKLLYTSDNLGDLYVTLRMFEEFTTSLYHMEMFYGEPVIQELIKKTSFVREEIQRFEEIYGLTTDVEALEEDIINDREKNDFDPQEEA
tara:strand:+ start:4380 stop:4724 length:345 start_codon:yes stop_codon:yes gene_type:complete